VEPTAEEVRQQLDRILASALFANADRLSRFLRYVVERTLAGEGDQLKEYAVGVGVFDRGEQYDPRVDSIVRVEASRLRTKIDEYYRSTNGADAVVIRLPKGTYTPEFEARQRSIHAPSHTSGSPPARRNRRWLAVSLAAVVVLVVVGFATDRTRNRPAAGSATAVTLAVLPFEVFSADPDLQLLAARVTDGVTTEVARLGTVSVVSHTSALQFAGVRRPMREIAQTLGAELVLEGSVELSGEQVRVAARLVDGVLDRKIWVQDFAGRRGDLPALQREIAAATATAAANRRQAR
jgi:TolB-like protein